MLESKGTWKRGQEMQTQRERRVPFSTEKAKLKIKNIRWAERHFEELKE